MAAARGRVYARLERALTFPIVVVSAPAGYGKSTVVRDVLQMAGIAHRYVELDAIDGDVLGVLRALATAVADVAPAFAASFATVYDRLADMPDGAEQLARWAAQYLTSIQATLVVDGLDGATDPRVAALVAELVDQTSQTVRWIIIPESSEHFPIPRWMAQGRMDTPIDDVDLALAQQDLVAAGDLVHAPMLAGRFVRLGRLAGGWPAAIALGIAVPGVDLLTAPGDPAALYAFLAEALLATFSASERTFLDRTCLFRGFDAALLECAGILDAGEIITSLRDGAGVLAVNAAGAYQYDRLFVSFLRAHLRVRAADAFSQIAVDTARAYERDGRFAFAIDVHVERGDHHAVGNLLGTHGFGLMERGESGAIGRALDSLPHDVLLAYPAALAVKASLESLHGKFDVAEAWFRLALDSLTDESERDVIVYHFAIDLVRRERSDVIELLAPVAAAISVNAPLAAPMWGLLATAYAIDARAADASCAIERALRLLPLVRDPGQRARVVHQAGFVALHRRDIVAAKAFALEAYRDASNVYSYDVAARALSLLYNIAIDFDDDVAAGRWYLERLAEASVRAGSRQLFLYATLCRYEIEVLSGDVGAMEFLNDQLQSLEVFFSVLITETLLPAQALQAAWSGDFYRAYRLLEPSAENQIGPERQAYRYAEISVYAAAAGLRDEASAAAERALSIVRPLGATDKTVLQTRAFIALTFVLTRRPARAAKLLAELTDDGAENERVRRVVAVVRSLAERWRAQGDTMNLAAELAELEAFDLGGLARMVEALPLPETARSRVVQLTSAERTILGLLSSGASAQQIAVTSSSADSTVEARIASICRKLGCNGWRHAVALARDEKILAGEGAGATP